jgi:rod shape-determining protein MreC
MNFNDPFKLRGIRIAILQGISWAQSLMSGFETIHELKTENRKLQQKLLEESLKNQRLQENMLENLRLRRLLNFGKQLEFSFAPASVIGFGQEKSIRSLILNVGREKGIEKNMCVVTDQGLVGKILSVDYQYAVTQILMDRNSLVSARLQRSREVGVIGWSGNLWLDFNYIPRDVVVSRGEIVVTSGLSKIYPKGIKIGVVSEVTENEYELFKQIKVKPAVDFNRVEEVFIIQSADTLNGSAVSE